MTDFCPYKMLDIARDANDALVKRAYRKLCLIYHPDKVGNDTELAMKFKHITRARDVLLDSRLRQAYNQGGWELVEHVEGHISARKQQIRKCEPTVIEHIVNIKQLYDKEKAEVIVPFLIYDESGASKTSEFKMSFNLEQEGKIVAENQGVQRPDCVPGDIIVSVVLDPDSPFTIRRSDLVYTVNLDLRDILVNYNILITHPSGILYNIKGRYKTQDKDEDNILIFKGLGMHSRSDLIVHLVPDLGKLQGLNASETKAIIDILNKALGPLETNDEALDITSQGKTPQEIQQEMSGMGMGMAQMFGGMGDVSSVQMQGGAGECPIS